jgi:hypothetical protein
MSGLSSTLRIRTVGLSATGHLHNQTSSAAALLAGEQAPMDSHEYSILHQFPEYQQETAFQFKANPI